MGGFRVERVSEADWERWRDLRLEMLLDTPMAYLESHAEALGHGEAEWRFRARRTSGTTNAGFVAVDAASGRWVATMSAYESTAGVVALVSVYVAPDRRGRAAGVADALLEECVGWARGRGASVVRLLVHEDNARARGFYERSGFVATGYAEPYPLDASRSEVEMELRLDGG